MSDVLHMWTVYMRPKDYPDLFVARRFEISGDSREPRRTADMFTADTLEEIRALLPPGLKCLPRFKGDDPVIVEVWL